MNSVMELRFKNVHLLEHFEIQLTYLLQIGGFLLPQLQVPERIYGQRDKIVQTLVVPLIFLLDHQQNIILCHLMLGTEEPVVILSSELDLATLR